MFHLGLLDTKEIMYVLKDALQVKSLLRTFSCHAFPECTIEMVWINKWEIPGKLISENTSRTSVFVVCPPFSSGEPFKGSSFII